MMEEAGAKILVQLEIQVNKKLTNKCYHLSTLFFNLFENSNDFYTISINLKPC